MNTIREDFPYLTKIRDALANIKDSLESISNLEAKQKLLDPTLTHSSYVAAENGIRMSIHAMHATIEQNNRKLGDCIEPYNPDQLLMEISALLSLVEETCRYKPIINKDNAHE
jgi:hypothetical protein